MKTRVGKGIIYGIISIIGFMLLLWLMVKPTKPKTETIDYSSEAISAYNVMKNLVIENYLKAPRTAKFPHYYEV
jgi:hypothetical protein